MAQSKQLAKILKGKIWKFFGGIKPQELKKTGNIPIRELPLPEYVSLPVNRHLGQGGKIIVSVGDKVKVGQPLTIPGGNRNVPLHASISGEVIAISDHVIAHPSGALETCITIKGDGKDNVYPPEPITDWETSDADTLLKRIRDYGVEGLGGAQFQTAAKLGSSIKGDRNCNIFIVNGCECEPVATCDDRLMQERADDIIAGIKVIKRILNPKAVIIAIEDNKTDAINAIQSAVKDEAIVRVLPTLYPSGAARNLIKIVTGIEIPYSEHTSDCGIVVDNVETVFAVKQAVIDGIPLTKRAVTVDGENLSDHGNAWIRLGSSVDFVLKQFSFTPQNGNKVIFGGPFMGFTLPDLSIPVTKSCTCLFTPSEKELPPAGTERNCIRCGRCARVCPSRLVPYRMYALSKAGDHKKTLKCGIKDCTECGCCAYVCPSKIPLTSQFRKEKAIIRILDDKQRRTDRAKERMRLHDERLKEEAKIREAKRQAALARIAKQKEEAAKNAENSKSENNISDSARKAAIAAALARKKNQDKNSADAASLNSEELKQRRQAAIAAALARKKAQSAADKTNTAINETAKKTDKDLTAASTDTMEQKALLDISPEEIKRRRQAAIAAALARKKAQSAADKTNTAINEDAEKTDKNLTVPSADTMGQKAHSEISPEEIKCRRQAAIAAALARKKAQSLTAEQQTKTKQD
ncbi:electron transport complex subunit RsxC [uncultured Succinatimonas sp.]|uniref:electron transport complex subunit RsxC n=1 Tax=uncultured Succinatimonas sp. TaxID=1262973 RepID=UPI0025CCF763|nr:electron transport complex subunit RsxC [uncultured Succinatimonas sp.]